MRDLTKSVTSYTWAMSVFWTQQLFNFLGLGGSGSWDRSARAFTNVTDATANEMGDTMRAVFRSGDTLQRGMVDVFMAPFSWAGEGSNGNGGRGSVRPDANRGGGGGWAETATRAAQTGANATQATVDTTARAAQRAAGAVAPARNAAPPSSDPSLGWGPMPR